MHVTIRPQQDPKLIKQPRKNQKETSKDFQPHQAKVKTSLPLWQDSRFVILNF